MLRGNHAAKIDDKGRLKIPNAFRALIEKQHGTELFVTSLTGEYVRLYPMPVWLALEEKLARMPSTHPSRLKYLDRVNYCGQTAQIDVQGRVVIHAAAARFGGHGRRRRRVRPDRHARRLEPRALRREAAARAVRRRRRARAVGVRDLTDGRAPRTGARLRNAGAPRAVARRPLRRLHRRPRRPQPGAARGGRVARARPRSRCRRARARRRRRSRRSAIASSSCTPTIAISIACSTARGIERVAGALADLGVSSMQLGAEGRGFSFQRDEPLDMRMDRIARADGGRSAGRRGRGGARERDLPVRRGALLAAHRARHRAGARTCAPVATTGQLAQIVRRAIPVRGHQRIDPATRTFQALRIWVNRELDGLDTFLGARGAAAAGRRRGWR